MVDQVGRDRADQDVRGEVVQLDIDPDRVDQVDQEQQVVGLLWLLQGEVHPPV